MVQELFFFPWSFYSGEKKKLSFTDRFLLAVAPCLPSPKGREDGARAGGNGEPWFIWGVWTLGKEGRGDVLGSYVWGAARCSFCHDNNGRLFVP
jgi:hypothetical protein